jgi:uncharacterized protein (DUF2235 family)
MSESAKKRLAVFLDGTWNTVNDNTCVWRLKALCADYGKDGLEQRAYYDPGVGTGLRERVLGGGFGVGINTNVIDAREAIVGRNGATEDTGGQT